MALDADAIDADALRGRLAGLRDANSANQAAANTQMPRQRAWIIALHTGNDTTPAI
jgi:hypothetical protein